MGLLPHVRMALRPWHYHELLRRMGLDYPILDSGCCGMAGSFGFEAEHYEVAMKGGERVLLPEVRAAPTETLIMTDGYSCREQIRHGTGRRACIWPRCFAGRSKKAGVNARLEEIVKSKQLQAGPSAPLRS